jgi:hypothetical protein
MAAPTNTADVKKTLANSEPSTHGPSPHFTAMPDVGSFRTEADTDRQARTAGSVANDPKATSNRLKATMIPLLIAAGPRDVGVR